MRLIRTKEVLGMIGVSRTTLWRMVRAGRFPSPVAISSWAAGFRDDEVEAWLEGLQRRSGRKAGGAERAR